MREQDRSFAETEGGEITSHAVETVDGENKVYSSDYAWGKIDIAAAGLSTDYLYGTDGQRAVKRSGRSEVLYFNKFFYENYEESYRRFTFFPWFADYFKY